MFDIIKNIYKFSNHNKNYKNYLLHLTFVGNLNHQICKVLLIIIKNFKLFLFCKKRYYDNTCNYFITV